MELKDKIRDLEESYKELCFVKDNDFLLLQKEFNKKNPIAIEIMKYLFTLKQFYFNVLDNLKTNKDYEFNFSDVGVCQYNIEDLKNNLLEDFDSEYKISDLVDFPVIDSKINLVDFKRHLKKDIALNKKIIMNQNGRPEKAEYTYNDDLVAIITFVFETHDNNLLKSRKEILNYIKKDESIGDDIIIKNQKYDLTNEYDAKLVFEEIKRCRKNIVDQLYMQLLGMINILFPDKTQYECIKMFQIYDTYSFNMRNDFINLGLNDWKESLENLDLNNLENGFEFLGYKVPNTDITIRDFIVQKITR